MKANTILSENILNAGSEARYDVAVKQLLADKMILAWILKSCVEEFRDKEIREIAERGIEGEPQIAETAVMPDETNVSPRITGTGVEDVTVTEGTVMFDIRFHAVVPEGERVTLLINVEAQNDFYPGYPLIKRGIYYCSRMISSQYGTVFVKSHYEKIRKVYSIWVCPNPPKERKNTITEYSIAEKNHVGCVKERKSDYDLLTAVMICLGDSEDDSCDGILRLLGILLSSDIEAERKRSVLENEFGIPMTEDIERRVTEMCNLSKGVREKGREEGRREGREEGRREGRKEGREEGRKDGRKEGVAASIENIMKKLKMTIDEAMDVLDIPEKEQPEYRAMLKKQQ